MICCPLCRGDFLEQPGWLTCSACGARFPLRDGVPDLVPESAVLPSAVVDPEEKTR